MLLYLNSILREIYAMKKGLLVYLIFIILCPITYAQSVIRVLNWTDYMDPALLDQFTKQTGIRVIYGTFHTNSDLSNKMKQGKYAYDVVFPSANFVSEMATSGVLQKLDKAKIPNWQYSWALFNEKTALLPAVNEYSINWMWGSIGIAYNPKFFTQSAPLSLDIIFDPAKIVNYTDCGILIIDDADDVLNLALLYLNMDPATAGEKELQAAKKLIEGILPYAKIVTAAEQIKAIASGRACLALAYSGDVLMAQEKADRLSNGIQIEYVVPKKHELLLVDQMAIPANAENLEGAYAFINFLMEPKNNAQAQNYLKYASGNKASHFFVEDKNRSNPVIFLSEETIKTAYISRPQNMQQRQLRMQVWGELIAASKQHEKK